MRTIFSLLLICNFVFTLAAQNVPIVPKFAVEGACWYYKNVGLSSDIVKHIYIERKGDSLVEAFNFQTKKYESISGRRLIFHYLDKDSQSIEYDTLLVRSDTFGIYCYDAERKIFNFFYNNLRNSNSNLNVESVNPLAKVNANYQNVKSFYQKLLKGTCATINGKLLGYYKIGGNMHCNFYPLGNEIIERIGSTYYMLRFDSCRKDLYGGPLLWYYDPEIGLYQHGKTKVEVCKDDSTIVNSIFTNTEDEKSLNIYPVPFAERITIENSAMQNVQLYIYAVDGKCFYKGLILPKSETNINTSLWPPGIYLVRQQSNSGTFTSKIIKQ